MDLTIENIILIGSILLLVSIIAGRASYKFGIPTLLLFLVVGMLAGSEGVIGIEFDNPRLTQFIGVISLNFILFSGGLDTNWNYIKPVFWRGFILSTLGVLITAASVGGFMFYLTDFNLLESFLLGAIVSSTDAAAVFSILRSKNIALKKGLRPTLEMESGSNDPMAYVLTISVLSFFMNEEATYTSVILVFLQQMIIGGALGFLFGILSKYIINSISLSFEGLYPVLVIALMFITYSATDVIGGNGFLAIYICAVYLGSHALYHKRTILKMFDGMAWLMEIVLFLTLGLLVFPSEIIPVMGIGILLAIFMILIARPLSIFISLAPFKVDVKSKLFVSWVGLRGAVPIVFATFPLLAGIDKAPIIFNIVFFVSVISVLIQGTTLSTIAGWLGVSLPEGEKRLNPTDILLSEHPKTAMREIVISKSSSAIGKKILELDLPKTAIIAMIHRNNIYITPNGSTEIRKGDNLIVLSDNEEGVEKVHEKLRV